MTGTKPEGQNVGCSALLGERTSETRAYYLGVKACGCATAMMRDDETTTESEITEFARDMYASERVVERRHITRAEHDAVFAGCRHTPNASLTGGEAVHWKQ